MFQFAVFGNPIAHSKSPEIYSYFASEFGISKDYGRILVRDSSSLEYILRNFFENGGLGANITLPIKELSYDICDNLTERASLVGAVNTIKKQENGLLLGDNTDGIGLLSHLKDLGWLRYGNKVLILGAGGAARSIIVSLLNNGCSITLCNRTFLRAERLVNLYKKFGNIKVIAWDQLVSCNDVDMIINATSADLHGSSLLLPDSLINADIVCYDMFYQKGDTFFMDWCKGLGAVYCSNGLGMLVWQAAYSFYLWHGLFPSIRGIVEKLLLL